MKIIIYKCLEKLFFGLFYLCLIALGYVLCLAYGHADTCNAIAGTEVCTQTGSITTADGYTYTAPDNCKQKTYQQNCTRSAPLNQCAQLESRNGCTPSAAPTCVHSDNTGLCDKYQYTYQCTGILTQANAGSATITGTVSQESSSSLDSSACSALSGNTQCVANSSTCIGGAQTRIINGVSVTKSCWEWSNSYNCVGAMQVGLSCQEMQNNPQCTQASKNCVLTNDDGSCSSYEIKYICGGIPKIDTSGVNSDINSCISGAATVAGKYSFGADSQKNNKMAEAATWLNVMRQAGSNGDFDPNSLQIFKGEQLSCEINNIVNFSNCCTNKGWGQGIGLASCSAEDKKLAQSIGAKLTVYVGQYCSHYTKLLFVKFCDTKKRVYCKYNSKLSRIIQQQGRPMLGKNFGSPPSPDCSGYSAAELQSMDFSRLDLSEVLPDLLSKITVPSAATIGNTISTKVQDFYNNLGN